MELNMYELAEQLKQLREEKKDAEQRVKDINADIDKTEYALVQLMAETETQNFTRAGTMFSLTTKTRASAMAGHKDELFSALKANSLSAFVKEQISENQDTVPDWLNGLINVYEQTSVSVRKSTK